MDLPNMYHKYSPRLALGDAGVSARVTQGVGSLGRRDHESGYAHGSGLSNDESLMLDRRSRRAHLGNPALRYQGVAHQAVSRRGGCNQGLGRGFRGGAARFYLTQKNRSCFAKVKFSTNPPTYPLILLI